MARDLVIYSDGGCIGNPGPGGWGAIAVRGGHHRELGGGEPGTTNNRMEMTGAIEGLKLAQPGERVEVVTDSRYLVDGASKWIHGWKKRGWRKADGDEVLNRDLWEEIDRLCSAVKVKWQHVKGHAGHPENERCDDIANGFARGEPPELKEGDGAWIARAAATKNSKGKKKAAKVEMEEGPYDAPLYLSLVGGDVQEHASWPECDARIRGVRGSRCKKVKSRREHVETLEAWKELV